jgi:hypothetical protein
MDERHDFGLHDHRFSNGRKCNGRLRFYQAATNWVIHGSTQKISTVDYDPYLMARCDECGIAGVLVER